MKSVSIFGQQVTRRDAAVAALSAAALAAITLAPQSLFAQLPNFQAVTDDLQSRIAPVITFIRYGVAVAAVMVGFFEAFKASKGGQAKGWMNAILLFIVAGIAVSPRSFFELLQLKDLSNQLGSWGF